MCEIRSEGITIGKQMVAVNIIKEQEKGRLFLLNDKDIMRITQLSKEDLKNLTKWTMAFERVHISIDFADKFTDNCKGEYSEEERAWIQEVVYNLFYFFFSEENKDASAYVNALSVVKDNVIKIVMSVYDVKKIRHELAEPLFLQKLHFEFLNYIVDLIDRARHTLTWDVISLMGDFKIDKIEIENLIRKYGNGVRASICACKKCGEYLGIDILNCGPVLMARCPNCGIEVMAGSWDQVIEDWNNMVVSSAQIQQNDVKITVDYKEKDINGKNNE